VYLVWHGRAPDAPAGEEGRGVFVARSTDEGKTFAREQQISPRNSGVCPCCGLRAFATHEGNVFVLYRAASGKVNRMADAVLVMSHDRGTTFETVTTDPWQIAACPMSSATITQSKAGVLSAWETAGQVHGALVDPVTARVIRQFTPEGTGKRCWWRTIAAIRSWRGPRVPPGCGAAPLRGRCLVLTASPLRKRAGATACPRGDS
jgi:hypothetical protein